MRKVVPDMIKFIVANLALIAMMVFVLPSLGHAKVFSSSTINLSIKPTEEQAEKNITNVKVMYNPIAEEINVNFKLAKSGTVSIKLMDALGNEVLNLSNGNLDAGIQSLSFDTNGKVSPGFYFVKLTNGAENVIKRISIR